MTDKPIGRFKLRVKKEQISYAYNCVENGIFGAPEVFFFGPRLLCILVLRSPTLAFCPRLPLSWPESITWFKTVKRF